MAIAIALFVLFLLALTALAFAAVRIFSRRDASGKSEPLGCLGGCAVGLGLFFLGFLGLIALAAALALLTGTRIVEHNPIERVWVGTYGDGTHDAEGQPIELFHDPARPLHVVLEARSDRPTAWRIAEQIEHLSDLETKAQVQEGVNAEGKPVYVIDIAIRADARDLADLEREIREIVEGFRLSEGVHVKLRDFEKL